MKGSPMKLGTIQGTAGHRSALKMKMEKDAAAKLKKESAMKMKMEAAAKLKEASAMKAKTYSQAYADMEDAEGGGKKDKFGRVYKDEASFTKAAKEYNVKTYGTTNPTAEAKKQNITKKQLAEKKKKSTEKKPSNTVRELVKDENKDGTVVSRFIKKIFKKKDKSSDSSGTEKKKKKGFGPSKMKKESMAKMKKEGAMKMKKESAMKMKKESMAKMKKAPSKFNAKLKAASAAGKLSGKFKEAVDAAPVKIGKTKSMKKATRRQSKFAEIARKNEDKFKKLTPKERKALLEKVKKPGQDGPKELPAKMKKKM